MKTIFMLIVLCSTAGAQQVAVVDFESVVTRNCVFKAEADKIIKKYAPERAQLATLKGPALKDFALKTQTRIDADFTALFDKQSVDVAQFEREFAHERKYTLLLDSSVRDKKGRPLAVMYADLEPESGIDVTNLILSAYNAKNGCAASDMSFVGHTGNDSTFHDLEKDNSRKP